MTEMKPRVVVVLIVAALVIPIVFMLRASVPPVATVEPRPYEATWQSYPPALRSIHQGMSEIEAVRVLGASFHRGAGPDFAKQYEANLPFSELDPYEYYYLGYKLPAGWKALLVFDISTHTLVNEYTIGPIMYIY